MPRKAILLGVAIAVLLGLSLAIIFGSTREQPPLPEAAASPPPASPPAAPAPLPAAAPPPAAAAPPQARAPEGSAAGPVPEFRTSDPAHPAPPNLGKDLAAALKTLREAVAGCASQPSARADEGEAQGGGRRVVLDLDIETLDGSIRVAGATVSRGPAGDPAVACALRILRGQTLEAPAANRGGRMHVPLTLRL